MPLVTRTTTQGSIIKQDEEPTDKSNGTLWINTSTDSPTIAIANGTDYKGLRMQLGTNPVGVPIEAFL